MIVSLIAAMSENRVIGRAGAVPWRLPEDMRFFKETTTGHTVIMGRKTFETLPAPLTNRHNVVVTSRRSYAVPDGVTVVHSLDEALATGPREEEVFVAGGEEIYRQALPRADRIYLTVVHRSVDGDTFFPEFDDSQWDLVRDDERGEFSFRLYERRSSN